MRLLLVLLFSSFVSAQIAKIEDKAIPVTVQMLSQLLVERELVASAQTVSLNHSSIASENMALIESIHVDIGQQVELGQVLLELESTDFYLSLRGAQASLSSNQAQIKQAELRLKRAEELIEKKYIADDDLLARQTELNVLRAESRRLEIAIEQANRALRKTIIKAPFDAVVSKRYANVGSFVSVGQNLFDLVQMEAPIVSADIPEHLAESLMKASRINFNNGNNSYPLKLKTLSPLVDSGSRMQTARFEFATQSIAKIGASGQVVWSVDNNLLPADLVVRRKNQLGVFVAYGVRARFFELKHAQEGRPVQIELAAPTLIIVGGRERLQDGDYITLKK